MIVVPLTALLLALLLLLLLLLPPPPIDAALVCVSFLLASCSFALCVAVCRNLYKTVSLGGPNTCWCVCHLPPSPPVPSGLATSRLATHTAASSAAIRVCSWDAGYQAISLGDLPHRRLTKPTRVMEIAFDGDNKSRGRCAPATADGGLRATVQPAALPLVPPSSACIASQAPVETVLCTPFRTPSLHTPLHIPPPPPSYIRESMLKLEVVEEGLLNAVVFWFDLHLDDCETLSNGGGGLLCSTCLPS